MFCFVDGHCDTITKIMDSNEKLYKNNCHIDIERLKKFDAPLQFFAIWLSDEKLIEPKENTIRTIKYYNKQLKKNKKYIKHCNNFDEILENNRNKKISSVLTLEGAEPLENNFDNLFIFYEQGIRGITLTWNYENCVGFGVGTNVEKGLKPFGIELIKKMNELKMIIDVSHLNEKGFWDVYKNSKSPFIASHSNSFNVCKHKRNLDDKQLKAIKEVNGLVGLNFHLPFLNIEQNKDSGFEYILKQVDYMLNLIGDENICLGCDFDGTNYLAYDTKDVLSLYYVKHWIEIYFGKEVANKIFSENYFSFLEKNF